MRVIRIRNTLCYKCIAFVAKLGECSRLRNGSVASRAVNWGLVFDDKPLKCGTEPLLDLIACTMKCADRQVIPDRDFVHGSDG